MKHLQKEKKGPAISNTLSRNKSDVFKEMKARALGAKGGLIRKETGAIPSKALQATDRNMDFILITMGKTNVGREVTGSYLH